VRESPHWVREVKRREEQKRLVYSCVPNGNWIKGSGRVQRSFGVGGGKKTPQPHNLVMATLGGKKRQVKAGIIRRSQKGTTQEGQDSAAGQISGEGGRKKWSNIKQEARCKTKTMGRIKTRKFKLLFNRKLSKSVGKENFVACFPTIKKGRMSRQIWGIERGIQKNSQREEGTVRLFRGRPLGRVTCVLHEGREGDQRKSLSHRQKTNQ